MRRLLSGAVFAAAFTVAAPSQASCIASLKWHGHQYGSVGDQGDVTAGAELAEKAKIPGCNDVVVNGQPRIEPPTFHTVQRVESARPTIALLLAGTAWFNVSTFPTLASHPLHALVASRQRPDGRTKACTITGTALPEPAGFRLRYGRKRTGWLTTTPDADVRLQRHGTGYVPRGTRIRVRGVCEPSTHFTNIVADRITRA